MITKIGFELRNSCNYNLSNKKNKSKKSQYAEISYPISYVPFLGNLNKDNKSRSVLNNSDVEANVLLTKKLPELAKEKGLAEVTPLLAYNYFLREVDEYISDLDSGKKDYKLSEYPNLVYIYADKFSESMFSNDKLREKSSKVIKSYIDKTEKLLKEESTKAQNNPVISDYFSNLIWSSRNKKNNDIDVECIVDATFRDKNSKIHELQDEFWNDMCQELMINDSSVEQKKNITSYIPKAEEVVKHLSVGNNVFITYDKDKESPESFIDTVHKVLSDRNGDSVSVVEFNKNTNTDYFYYVISKAKKNKSQNYIIIANPTYIENNINDEDEDYYNDEDSPQLKNFKEIIANPPSNVKYILYDSKNYYYSDQSRYSNFEEVVIPALSVEQLKKAFIENPNLYQEDIKIPFSKSALDIAIGVSYKLEGVFPEKSVNFLKKIENYNKNKKHITDKDVNEYLKEADYIFKKDNSDSSVEIIFDTETKLKDLIGKDSTKKEAEVLVKQIKSKKMGTKGLLIYSQDGYPGGGRRKTAKAIAGEAKIPYIEINSMDFGTKDVDLFGDNSLSPEKSMKKLFSMVSTQAEENSNKSAVLYIENFELFSVGEEISTYYQKAMAQLLREMEKADKAGLNILVVGAVGDADAVGETAMKSFKFVDKLEVTSTAYSKEDRKQVIASSLQKLKIKLEGSKEKQDNLISYMADISSGFPFLMLQNLIKKAQSVAKERNHRELNKSDLTEAYLQLTTGRPNTNKIRKHEADIVASHECGHAVNLEVMNNIAKTIGKNWHIPHKVNFITLDPRGYYGGAVFDGRDENNEESFENAFADIVCGFGGNSAENRFYGIDGSLGITADMDQARNKAMVMVRAMGMGAKTGKMTIYDGENLSDKLKEIIETDERTILHNAKITSDLITEIYQDFNKEFTEKYSPLVGSGECILDGDEFRKALNEWKLSQSPEKQKELKECDKVIVEIMEATKRGVEVQKSN